MHKPSPPSAVSQTLSALSEGIKYVADRKNRDTLVDVMRKIISHSLFLTTEQRQTYLLPLRFLHYDTLLELKDVFIRENMRYLEEMVRKNLLEREAIERLKMQNV